jgi:hypothetical protein
MISGAEKTAAPIAAVRQNSRRLKATLGDFFMGKERDAGPPIYRDDEREKVNERGSATL